jgi:hypothetical protein
MKNKRALQIAWLSCCLAALVWWYITYGIRSELSETLRAESQIHLIVVMVVITFPMGLAWAYVVGLITYGLEGAGIGTNTTWHLDVLLWWLGFVVVGYVQWFKLGPRIVEVVRTRNRRQHSKHSDQ